MATTQGQIGNLQKPPCSESVSLTTNGSGAATGTLGPFTGFLDTLIVTKGTLDDTADLTVTISETSEQVGGAANITASRVVRPRVTPHGIDGVALAALTILERPFLFNQSLTLTVSQGGNTKTGTVAAIFV